MSIKPRHRIAARWDWENPERLRCGRSRCAEAFGSSVIVVTEHLLYAESEVIDHDQYDLGGHS